MNTIPKDILKAQWYAVGLTTVPVYTAALESSEELTKDRRQAINDSMGCRAPDMIKNLELIIAAGEVDPMISTVYNETVKCVFFRTSNPELIDQIQTNPYHHVITLTKASKDELEQAWKAGIPKSAISIILSL